MSASLKSVNDEFEEHNAKILKIKRWVIFKEKRAAVIDLYIKIKKQMFLARKILILLALSIFIKVLNKIMKEMHKLWEMNMAKKVMHIMLNRRFQLFLLRRGPMYRT